mmetsp:Transcript_15115/g.49282  ORF Transcript_15115/g.49282 Transcript_15115/m.49282 type:complete len:201 (-) Transcript_15115:785-1387(-)
MPRCSRRVSRAGAPAQARHSQRRTVCISHETGTRNTYQRTSPPTWRARGLLARRAAPSHGAARQSTGAPPSVRLCNRPRCCPSWRATRIIWPRVSSTRIRGWWRWRRSRRRRVGCTWTSTASATLPVKPTWTSASARAGRCTATPQLTEWHRCWRLHYVRRYRAGPSTRTHGCRAAGGRCRAGRSLSPPRGSATRRCNSK